MDDFSRFPLDDLESILHEEERMRYNGYANPTRKMSFLCGRYCAKKAILRSLEISNLSAIHITSGVFNQPCVVYPGENNFCVSISHSGSAAIALAYPEEYPMGVDIETINEERSALISTELTDKENDLSNHVSLDSIHFSFVCWTAKESLSKILRTGFTTALSIFEIDTMKFAGDLIQSTFLNFSQYKAVSKIFNDTIVTIVTPRSFQPQALFAELG